jgi:hypothetical protein
MAAQAIGDPSFSPPYVLSFADQKDKVSAVIEIKNLQHTYDGSVKSALATTDPQELNVNLIYKDSAGASVDPINVGVYSVLANVSDTDYEGVKTETLIIGKATPVITPNSNHLVQFDLLNDERKEVGFVVTPEEVANKYVVSYKEVSEGDGYYKTLGPDKAGKYDVKVIVDSENYYGSYSGILEVASVPDSWGQLDVLPSESKIIYSTVSVDGTPAGSDLLLGAFVGGKLRGMQQLLNPLINNKNYAIFVINAGAPAKLDIVSFKLFDHGNNVVFGVADSYTLENNIGSYGNPVSLGFDATPPVITLNGDPNVMHEAGSVYTDSGASALDAVDGVVEVTITGLAQSNIPGDYTLKYSASDKVGNKAKEVIRKVSIKDTTGPLITLRGLASVTHEAGEVYADKGAIANDSVDGPVSVKTIGDVNQNKTGSYTLIFNAVDAVGNKSTETRSINVVDTMGPVIRLKHKAFLTHEAGVSYKDSGASAVDVVDGDLSGVVEVLSTVDISKVGSYSVTYSVSDANGNAAIEVARVVNVVDTTPPVITLLGGATIQKEALAEFIDPGVNVVDLVDGNLDPTITGTIDVNTVGTYVLKYNAKDSSGNSAVEVQRTVTVGDTGIPVISINGDVLVVQEAKGTYVDRGAKASDALDGNLTGAMKSVSTVNTDVVGDYSVTYSVSDSNGNTAVKVVRTVKVVDRTMPKITLLGSSSVTHEAKDPYVDGGVKAIDSIDGDLTKSVTVLSTVNTDAVGSYSVTYSVSDSSANAAVEMSRTVGVVDTTLPLITLSGSSTVTQEAKGIYVDRGAIASDTLDGNLTGKVKSVSTVNTDALGSYSVTYSVSDANGNAAIEVARVVNVVDTTPPVITLLGGATIQNEALAEFIDPGVNVVDLVDGNLDPTITGTIDVNTVGTYVLKYNAKDSAGNNAIEVQRVVTIGDTGAPVISLNGDVLVIQEAKKTFVDEGATAADTLDGVLAVKSVSTVNTDEVGDYSVTYSVIDSNGNAAVGVVRTVRVVDTTAPQITLIGSNTVTQEAKGAYVDEGATAVDTVDDSLSVKSVSTVNTDEVGNYSVSYSVSDANGNAAVEVVRTVKVVDTTVPKITLSGSSTVTHEAKVPYVDGGVSASDSLDGNLTGKVKSVSTVNTDAVGSYSVTHSVSDANGNAAVEALRTVNVVDTTVPKITLSGSSTVTHEAKVPYVDGGVSARDTLDGDLTDSVTSESTVNTDTVGSYSVTYNVSDANGNAAVEVLRTVKVVDTTVPQITLSGSSTVTHEAGMSFTDWGAIAVDSLDGDLSGNVDVVSTVDVSKPGVYTVSYGLSDAVGNKAKGVLRTVTIVDTRPPVIKLKGEALVLHEAGGSYTDAGASASDLADGDLSGELDMLSTVNIGKPGVYTVSYGVSDSVGNKARATIRKVSVVDTTGPVITLNGDEVVTHEAGGSYKDGGASAADVVDGAVSVQTSGDVNSNKPGSYTLVYSAVDSLGNVSAKKERTVTVKDTKGPMITLIGDMSVTQEAGSRYKDSGASAVDALDGDLSGDVKVVSTVDISKVGSYSVTFSLSDANGNAAVEVVRSVSVKDTTAPIITLLGQPVVAVELGQAYSDLGVSTVDAVEGFLNVEVKMVGEVDVSKVGEYQLRYNVSDSAGNDALEVIRTVVVGDTGRPVITLKGKAREVIEAGSSFTDAGASAADMGDGELSELIKVLGGVDTTKVGVYELFYSVKDSQGNAATQVTRKVEVKDTRGPVINLKGEVSMTHEAGSSYKDAGASAVDVVDGDLSVDIVSTVNTLKPGVYRVSYGVSDAGGNKAKGVVRTVRVVDTTGPVITLNGDEMVKHEAGGSYKDGGASGADVVDGAVSVQTSGDVNQNKPGSYKLVYSAVDSLGNVSVKKVRTVKVQDTTGPAIKLKGEVLVTHEAGSIYTDRGASAVDVVDGDLSGEVNVVSTVDVSKPGDYTVSYGVSDAGGNKAKEAVRKVKVQDTRGPVITMIGQTTVAVEVGEEYLDGGARAVDAVDGDLSVKVKMEGDVDVSKVGEYQLVYKVSDSEGNDGTEVVRTVVVEDTESPVITLKGKAREDIEAVSTPLKGVGDEIIIDGERSWIVEVLGDGQFALDYRDGFTSYEVLSMNSVEADWRKSSYKDAGASAVDVGDGDLSGLIKVEGGVDTGKVGVYELIYSVKDTHGNAAKQVTRKVSVVDTTGPVVTLNGGEVVTHEAGGRYKDGGATADDVVDGAVSVQTSGDVKSNKPGSYTLVYSAVDSLGNVSSKKERTVTVKDTTGPVIKSKGDLTVIHEAGSSYKDSGASAVDNVDGDLSGDVKVVSTVDISKEGSYSVTYNVSDAKGNAAVEVVRSVSVKDTTAPVITLSGKSVVAVEVGQAYLDSGAIAVDVVDGDLNVKVKMEGEVDVSKVGEYQLRYNVSDSAGNDALEVIRTVVVGDTGRPVITLKGKAREVIEAGSSYTDAGASAADMGDGELNGLIKVVGGVDTGKVGVYELFYSVKDSKGNAATQVTRKVEVRDTRGPVINLKGEVSVTHEAGSSYKDDGASAVDVVDGDLSVEIDIVSTVNTLKPGVYTVSYGVSDVAGNKANAVVRTVTVEDTTGPVITLNGDEVVKHEAGDSYKDGGASATDLVDGDLSGVVEVLSTVDASKPGSYTVSYGVSDTVGNKAKGLVRTVKVQDTTGPVIKLKGEVLVTHEAGSSYTDKGASVMDVVDGDLSEEVNVVSTVDVSKPGDYTVSYGVSDAAGNKSKEAVRKVKVQDSTGPVITLKGEALVTYEGGSSYTDSGASATDNLDGDLTEEIVVSGEVDTSLEGTYTLKYDVRDAEGNAAESATRVVVVEKAKEEDKTTVVQTLNLKAGWNLISFYVVAEDMSPATVLKTIKGNLAQIKDLKSSYNPALPGFLNTLKGLNVEDGYWVKVDANVIFELEGEVPAGASIKVKTGWNLVGYPRESGAAAGNELTSLGGIVMQFKNLKNSYNPALPSFLNTLKNIAPGLGYWLKVSADGVWNVGDVSGQVGNRYIVKMESLGESRWGQVVVYPNVSATVLAEVTVEEKTVSRGSVLAAFVGDELRGQQEVVLAKGGSYSTLNVNLQEGEVVIFRLWERESGKKYSARKSMKLQIGEMYGTVNNFVKFDWEKESSKVVLSHTRSPFGINFESELSQYYKLEKSSDLINWSVVEIILGNGKTIQHRGVHEDGSKVFYRLRVLNIIE